MGHALARCLWAYELLGWAYLVQAEQELGTGNLRRALALDPENWHAGRLLQQLSS